MHWTRIDSGIIPYQRITQIDRITCAASEQFSCGGENFELSNAGSRPNLICLYAFAGQS